MIKKTQTGKGMVTRVSSTEEKDFISFRIKTDDHKLTIDVKFKLEDWAGASTRLESPCVINVYEKENE